LTGRQDSHATDQQPGFIPSHDVVIVGGGAAGLATAIFARRANPSRSVLILERAKKPGAKILVSGGGRCNVTNESVSPADFWGGRPTVIRQVLRAFPVADTIAFFRDLGVTLHVEASGKLFPDTNRARDVLDALLDGAAKSGAVLVAGCQVRHVVRGNRGFVLNTSAGEIHAAAVVLATGGRSLPKSGSDGGGYAMAEALGHSIVATTPGLAPLVLANEDHLHRTLAGVSQDVELTVWVDAAAKIRIRGALLWTHFGVSGPAALDASRHWARARVQGQDVRITVNFCPGQAFDDVDKRLTALAAERPRSSIHSALAAFLPASVAAELLRAGGIDSGTALAHLTRDDRRAVSHALVERPLPVSDTRGYNYAEVTAGGVPLSEIDPTTMESRVCPGLYLVGEILDIDGRIGGFNFQWAWSSAHVAGRALGRR
jgi:predicted Rossmann fold flavoprotein